MIENLSHHPLYNVWYKMKQRCYLQHDCKFKRYGARGIIVCYEWKNNFEVFYIWAINEGIWKAGLQIDRINNDGNYEPSNCRFVTAKENIRNSTVCKLTKEIADSIKSEYIAYENGYKKLAKKYNTSWTNVRNIIRRNQWSQN